MGKKGEIMRKRESLRKEQGSGDIDKRILSRRWSERRKEGRKERIKEGRKEGRKIDSLGPVMVSDSLCPAVHI